MRSLLLAATALVLSLALPGCCPGPKEVGQYALQVFLQGPDDAYPTLAQVDLVVRSCAVY